MDATATQTEPVFFTLGQLARRLGTTTHKLKYAIDQRHVEPVVRVGIMRVWKESQIAAVQAALNSIGRNGKTGTP